MGICDIFTEPLNFACANQLANDLVVLVMVQQQSAGVLELSILLNNHDFKSRIGETSHSALYKTHT